MTGRLLEYTPSNRVPPLEACTFPFFEELRDSNTKLPNGRELPPIFNFSAEGEFMIFAKISLINGLVA